MTELRITGPNGDGEYWLHIKAGGKMGEINLGVAHGPLVRRLLDAAAIEAPDETAALRVKLAEAETERNTLRSENSGLNHILWMMEADCDAERKLAEDLARAFRATLEALGPDAVRSNALAAHVAHRKG